MIRVAVAHHPDRPAGWPDSIAASAGVPVHVTVDRGRGRWDTHRRALQDAAESDAEQTLLVQDDAILHPDILDACRQIGPLTQGRPVCLYVGQLRPHARIVADAVEAATDGTLLEGPGPWWAVCILLQTGGIGRWLPYADRHPSPNVDHKIAAAHRRLKTKCLYAIPSLADHRPEPENPSMIRGRVGDRRAHRFADVPPDGWEVAGTILRRRR